MVADAAALRCGAMTERPAPAVRLRTTLEGVPAYLSLIHI